MKQYAGLLLFVLVLYTQPTIANTQTEEDKAITAAQKLMKASVMIEPELFSTGSGFYISPDLIITNEHVLHRLPTSTVNFKNKEGQPCKASIGYREEKIDLALIRTSCTNDMYLR